MKRLNLSHYHIILDLGVSTMLIADVAAVASLWQVCQWWIALPLSIVLGLLTLLSIRQIISEMKSKRLIRDAFSELYLKGQELRKKWAWPSIPEEHLEKESVKWSQEVSEFLNEKLDKSYTIRFFSHLGIFMAVPTIDNCGSKQSLWDSRFHIYLFRLHEFITEFSK